MPSLLEKSFIRYVLPDLQGTLVNLREMRLGEKIAVSQMQLLLQQATIDYEKHKLMLKSLVSSWLQVDLRPVLSRLSPSSPSGYAALKNVFKLALLQR